MKKFFMKKVIITMGIIKERTEESTQVFIRRNTISRKKNSDILTMTKNAMKD